MRPDESQEPAQEPVATDLEVSCTIKRIRLRSIEPLNEHVSYIAKNRQINLSVCVSKKTKLEEDRPAAKSIKSGVAYHDELSSGRRIEFKR